MGCFGGSSSKIRIEINSILEKYGSLVAEVIDNTTSRGRTLRFLFDGPYEDFRAKFTDLGTHLFQSTYRARAR